MIDGKLKIWEIVGRIRDEVVSFKAWVMHCTTILDYKIK